MMMMMTRSVIFIVVLMVWTCSGTSVTLNSTIRLDGTTETGTNTSDGQSSTVENVTSSHVFPVDNVTSTPVNLVDNVTSSPVILVETVTNTPVILVDNVTGSPVLQMNNVTGTPVILANNVENSTSNRLLHLLPMDTITAILERHSRTDSNYSAAILYLQSPQWHNLTSALSSTSEWQALMSQFNRTGAPVADFLAYVAKGVAEARPTAVPSSTPSLRSAVEEVLDVVPFDKVMAEVNESKAKAGAAGGNNKTEEEQETRVLIGKVKALEEYKRVAEAFNKLDPLSAELKEVLFSSVV